MILESSVEVNELTFSCAVLIYFTLITLKCTYNINVTIFNIFMKIKRWGEIVYVYIQLN